MPFVDIPSPHSRRRTKYSPIHWALLLGLICVAVGWTNPTLTTRTPRGVRTSWRPLRVVSQDPTTGERQFMVLNATEDSILRSKGDAEAALMENNAGPLLILEPSKIQKKKAKKTRATTTAMGFGGGGSAKKDKNKKRIKRGMDTSDRIEEDAAIVLGNSQSPAAALSLIPAYADAIHKDGIVRIDNVLTETLADSLKEYLVDLRDRSRAAIESAALLDSQERFADVLLNRNRCDLKIPLGPDSVMDALYHILHETPLRRLIEHVFDSYGRDTGSAATLYELNCFMSQTGALRQLVHADNVCVEPGVLHEDEPVMLTLFVALQDTDLSMGPTTWILGTNNRAAHQDFYAECDEDTSSSPAIWTKKTRLLHERPKVVGTLPKGACAIFDPRTLHCAGANTCADPDATRALFYVSFKNPRVDYPGCPSCSGYGIVDAELTLHDLCEGLAARKDGGEGTTLSRRLDFLSCFP